VLAFHTIWVITVRRIATAHNRANAVVASASRAAATHRVAAKHAMANRI
jgi:hypothetical protein